MSGGAICRLWRGWTTPENADAYERVVRGEVIPGIEARRIPGFRHIDLMRRDAGDEVEFQTLMWFDSLDSIKAFMGEDYAVSHVPPQAQAVLKRFDERAAHFEVIDRREQDRLSRAADDRRYPPVADRFPQSSRRADRGRADGFVLLSGPNGAGKTNVLEAVSLLTPGRGPAASADRRNGAERRAGRICGRGAARRSDRNWHRNERQPLRTGGRCGSTARRQPSTRLASGWQCCG